MVANEDPEPEVGVRAGVVGLSSGGCSGGLLALGKSTFCSTVGDTGVIVDREYVIDKVNLQISGSYSTREGRVGFGRFRPLAYIEAMSMLEDCNCHVASANSGCEDE